MATSIARLFSSLFKENYNKFTVTMAGTIYSSLVNCQVVHPGVSLGYFNDGGGESDRGAYFIPQKIPILQFAYPKKSPCF